MVQQTTGCDAGSFKRGCDKVNIDDIGQNPSQQKWMLSSCPSFSSTDSHHKRNGEQRRREEKEKDKKRLERK